MVDLNGQHKWLFLQMLNVCFSMINVCLLFLFQKKIQYRTNDSYPITSISFHAREPLIFYSIDNRIVIWNYEENTKITDLFAMEESRIK